MEIKPASSWGRVFNGEPPKIQKRKVKELTIHYTGVPGPITVDGKKIAQLIKNTETNHLARREDNMSAIGYNFLIDKNGTIWEGRGWDYRNGANGNLEGNMSSISVCVLVGIRDNKLTQPVVDAIRSLREEAEKKMKVVKKRKISVRGHRDHKPTSCPGERIYTMIQEGVFNQPVGTPR
jgi:hypothetical protein